VEIYRAEAIAFGDLFLQDVRAYREQQLEGSGLEPLFPIWGLQTKELAQQMIAAGIGANITCLDPKKVPKELAGARFDRNFLDALPPSVDPCGENGEFHTCVWSGPMFAGAMELTVGEVVERGGFVYGDLFL
ncbi:MAG: ATP-binding protein, partial [Porticoccaceae bacterium]|nr:ATP-binding protein [Porticoccaceae bacterium]